MCVFSNSIFIQPCQIAIAVAVRTLCCVFLMVILQFSTLYTSDVDYFHTQFDFFVSLCTAVSMLYFSAFSVAAVAQLLKAPLHLMLMDFNFFSLYLFNFRQSYQEYAQPQDRPILFYVIQAIVNLFDVFDASMQMFW